MRLTTFVLAALGQLSALRLTAGAYVRQSQDLEPVNLFPRGYAGSLRPEIVISSDKNAGAEAAVLFVQAASAGAPTILCDSLSTERAARMQQHFSSYGFTGAQDSTIKMPGDDGDPAKLIIFTGVGREMNENSTRGAAAFGVREATGVSTKVAVMVPAEKDDMAAAAAEGAVSGAYVWDKYKSDRLPHIDRITIVTTADPAKIKHDATIAQYTNWARDIVNEPPNVLYPETFTEIVNDVAAPAGISVDIWDEQRLAADNLNGILAVGSGSDRRPRLVKLSYTPGHSGKRNNWKHVVFVGGGVSYDSGGLSGKPAQSLSVQRGDMAGAAAALKAVLAAHELQINTRITAWLPVAENMPGPGAMRVGDIIRLCSNKTIEIVDTDAESRVMMADAIAFARQNDEFDVLIDISTYTSSNGWVPPWAQVDPGDNGGWSGCQSDAECYPTGQSHRGDQEQKSDNADSTNGGSVANLLRKLDKTLGGGSQHRKRTDDSAGSRKGNRVHIDLGSLGWNPGLPYLDQPSFATGVGVKTLVTVAEKNAV